MSNSVFKTIFAKPAPNWGLTALPDQHGAGPIAWAFGEAPTIVVLLVLIVQWAKSDHATAQGSHGGPDRRHGADDYLAGLAERETGSPAQPAA